MNLEEKDPTGDDGPRDTQSQPCTKDVLWQLCHKDNLSALDIMKFFDASEGEWTQIQSWLPEDSSSFLGEPIWTVECKPANDHIYDRILVKIHSNSNANTVLRKLTNQTISWSMRERMVLRLIRGMHLLMQTPPSARREALENTQNVTRACYELRSMETIASSSSDDNAPFCHGYEDFSGKVWKAKELETAIVTIAELCDGRRAPSGIEGALWSKLFRFFAPHMNKRHFILEWCLPKGASFLINDIHDFRRYFRLRMDTAGNTEGVTLRALIFEDT